MGFPSGKEVDATKWWLPDPDKDSATELTFEHSRNLTVYDSPGHRFAEKSWGNIRAHAWPKQLYFRENIKVELVESVTWDLVKYPFDEQELRAKVGLLDRDKFATKTSYDTAVLNVTLPETTYTSDLLPFGRLDRDIRRG